MAKVFINSPEHSERVSKFYLTRCVATAAIPNLTDTLPANQGLASLTLGIVEMSANGLHQSPFRPGHANSKSTTWVRTR